VRVDDGSLVAEADASFMLEDAGRLSAGGDQAMADPASAAGTP
jgi:hypothetical protein